MPRVERLRHIVYPWADVVTANSRGALTALESLRAKARSSRSCPIPWPPRRPTRPVAFTAPTVITVGRLVEQKGIDVLLTAWAKVVGGVAGLALGACRRRASRGRAEGAGAQARRR